MTLQKWSNFIIGVYEKNLIFCWIQLKFRSWLHKKHWHTSRKFQFEKTSNKKVIANKRVANLYEMNRSCDVKTTASDAVCMLKSKCANKIIIYGPKHHTTFLSVKEHLNSGILINPSTACSKHRWHSGDILNAHTTPVLINHCDKEPLWIRGIFSLKSWLDRGDILNMIKLKIELLITIKYGFVCLKTLVNSPMMPVLIPSIWKP